MSCVCQLLIYPSLCVHRKPLETLSDEQLEEFTSEIEREKEEAGTYRQDCVVLRFCLALSLAPCVRVRVCAASGPCAVSRRERQATIVTRWQHTVGNLVVVVNSPNASSTPYHTK